MTEPFDAGGMHGNAKTESPDGLLETSVLAFIIFGQDGGNGYTGAIMLTDGRTRPLHFGFATPVRPSTIQRLLYGGTLDEFIKVDVIAMKLIRELPRVPDVMFVESVDLLATRRVAPFPVAALLPARAESEDNHQLSILQFSTGNHLEDHDKAGPLVAGLESSVNLLDPFGRMREALKEALKEVLKQTGRG